MHSCRISLLLMAGSIIWMGCSRASSNPTTADKEPDKEVTLAWKFTRGERLHYVMTEQMHQRQKWGERDLKIDMTLVMDIDWVVQEVEDGVATIAQCIDRVQIEKKCVEIGNNTRNEWKAEYDSAAEDNAWTTGKLMGVDYFPVVHRWITVKMNAQGKVLDVKLPNALADQIRLSPMNEMLSHEGIKEMIGIGALPEMALCPGASWTDTMTMHDPSGGKTTGKSTFTYVGPKTVIGKAVEEISVDLTPDMEREEKIAIPVDVTLHDARGVVHFDNTAGRLQDAKTSLKLTSVVKGVAPENKGDFDITVKVELTPGDQKRDTP